MNSSFAMASKIQVSMNRKLFLTALIFFVGWSLAWADSAVQSAQQKLKDGGFYYGEITGQKNTETTAAIPRYQIPNGLQITRGLNPQPRRSLRATSKPAPTPAAHPQPPPG